MVERIEHDGALMALVIRADHRTEGIEFFTPPDFSQQLASMNRPAGYAIAPHVHRPQAREVMHTREVLFVRFGSARVDLYDEEGRPLRPLVVRAEDVLLLARGGHGLTMLEQTEIVEVKQGPYAGPADKVLFVPQSQPSGGAQ